MVRLSTQGTSRAVASVTEDWKALRQRQKLNGAMATAAAVKTEGERRTTTTASRLLKDGQEARGSHDGAFSHASATTTDDHDAPGTPKKDTVHYNYRITIHLKFQITPKFV